MSRYTPLNSDLWYDAMIEQLSPNGKLFYLYLLTSPNCNAAGYYRLSENQVALNTGLDIQTVHHLLNSDNKLWLYDDETKQVLIPTFLKHNAAKSAKQISGLNAQIKGLEMCKLHIDFLFAVNKYISPDAVLKFDESILRYVKVTALESPNERKEAVLLNLLSNL